MFGRGHDHFAAETLDGLIDPLVISRDNDVIEVQKGLYAEALRFIAISTQNTQELLIDDFTILGKSQELTIKVPAPGAFLFHKGLTLNRRSESQKMGKDLYYMFEVLVHCIKLEVQIYEELRRIKLEYPIKWSNNFITNLATFFKDVTSYGCRLVLSQRTHGSIDSMNDNQFKQYVLGIFRSFIERLRSL